MNPRTSLKTEERPEGPGRSHTEESDISEDVAEEPRSHKVNYTDRMDREPSKIMRMEVSLASERRESDFYIYDKRVSGGVKITEHSLVFSRKKLEKEEVKVEANPLRLPSKLIYFEYDCKF
jgi:hypothetical protein